MTEPLYSGEAVCKRWGDSSSAGRTVTLQLEDGGEHPFRGYEGERFAIVVMPIGNDEKPMKKQIAPGRGEAAGGKTATGLDQSVVARPLDATPAAGNSKPKKRWNEMPPSQRAGMLCDEPEFWAFLNASPILSIFTGKIKPVDNADGAATVLRLVCGVTSRSNIKDGFALRKFEEIEGNFQAYRQARQHGAA